MSGGRSPNPCQWGVLAAAVIASSTARADTTLVLSAKAQVRAETIVVEDADAGGTRFLIPRAQVNADGHALSPDFRYRLSVGFNEPTEVSLRDLYANGVLVPQVLELRVGRFKRPLNRQFITSAYAIELTERAETTGFSASARDLGFMLHDGYDRSPNGVEWAVGAFNGRIASGDHGELSDIALVARVGWNFGGIDGYTEGDLAGGPLRAAVAVSGLTHADMNVRHELEVDAIAKVDGLDVSGAFFLRVPETDEPSPAVELGFHVQAGYFVLPRRLLFAGRFASIPATERDGRQTETRAGITYYVDGKALKVSGECGLVDETGDSAPGHRVEVRVQAQLAI